MRTLLAVLALVLAAGCTTPKTVSLSTVLPPDATSEVAAPSAQGMPIVSEDMSDAEIAQMAESLFRWAISLRTALDEANAKLRNLAWISTTQQVLAPK